MSTVKLEQSGTHQLLICFDNVNLLDENVNTVKKVYKNSVRFSILHAIISHVIKLLVFLGRLNYGEKLNG
jgi:hypothetical protein